MKRIFYGWVIVAACVLVTASGIGIYSMTNSAFLLPICGELGFSRGGYTLHRTIVTAVCALSIPFYGKLSSRWGVKKLMLLSVIGFAVSYLGYSVSTRLWHFYFFAAICGLATNGTSFLLVGTLINAWFDEKKGLATGIAYCGSGLGGSLALPLTNRLIDLVGWRWSYRVMVLAATAVLLPTILLLIKNEPATLGLKPLGSKPGKRRLPSAEALGGWTLGESLKKPVFWAMVLAFFCTSVCACGPNTHTVPYLQDIGYSAERASLVMSFSMVMLTVGKIVLGMIYDRFGTRVGGLFVGISCIAAPLLAMVAGRPAAAWAFAVLLGLETSGYAVPVSTLIQRHLGGRDFASIFSLCTMVTTVGGIVSVPVMGLMFDLTGSYRLAWIGLLVLGCCACCGFLGAELLGAKGRKREPEPAAVAETPEKLAV